MRIAVDAFGGDNAPLAVLKGAEMAVSELGVSILLTGDEQKIKECAKENNICLHNMEIVHTEEVFDMHTAPTELIKAGKNTSLALAMKAAADGEADAVVSAGSTGAIIVGATFIVKRIKGVKYTETTLGDERSAVKTHTAYCFGNPHGIATEKVVIFGRS